MSDSRYHVLLSRYDADSYGAAAKEISTETPAFEWRGNYEAAVAFIKNLYYEPEVDAQTTVVEIMSQLSMFQAFQSPYTFGVDTLYRCGFEQLHD